MTPLVIFFAIAGITHTAKLDIPAAAQRCVPSGPVCAIADHGVHDFANQCDAQRAGARMVLRGPCDDE